MERVRGEVGKGGGGEGEGGYRIAQWLLEDSIPRSSKTRFPDDAGVSSVSSLPTKSLFSMSPQRAKPEMVFFEKKSHISQTRDLIKRKPDRLPDRSLLELISNSPSSPPPHYLLICLFARWRRKLSTKSLKSNNFI